MRIRKISIVLLSILLFSSACGSNQPKITSKIQPTIIEKTQLVEVTRLVQATVIITVTPPPPIFPTQLPPVEAPTMVIEQPSPAVTEARATQPHLHVYEGLVRATSSVQMMVPRARHTVTRLMDGRVLVVGGTQSGDEHLSDVEIFDPAYGITIRAAQLNTQRHDHTATLLQDGRVLVVGGYNTYNYWLQDSEIYDPSIDMWSVVPMLTNHGVQHTATLMKDGRVLVVGGANGAGRGSDQAEIFDPQSNSWSAAAPLETDRASHTASLLDDGRVLIAGGESCMGLPNLSDALVYDPASNGWTATGSMIKPRIFATSVRLEDGRVLVAGGINLEDKMDGNLPPAVSSSVELYDPVSNTWSGTGSLFQARLGQVMVLLADGRVIVAGGSRDWDCCFTSSSYVGEVELYDPGSGTWSIALQIPELGVFSAAVVLNNGRVWYSGGQVGESGDTYLSSTWLFTP